MKLQHITAFLLLTIVATSCQKVINLKLPSSAPLYVVVGNITDQPGPYLLTITKTVGIDQDNIFPAVSGAIVYITDSNINFTDTLTETMPGNYQTHTLAGVPGHTYKMVALSNGNRFTSSSTMPQPIALDSVYTQASIFGNHTDVVPLYKDPKGVGNYYHLVLTVGDSISTQIYIHDDEAIDGNEVEVALRNDITISHAEPITVELQCVDQPVFDYYRDLQQTNQQNSATPANPQNNITGGCLGYFSAHTSRKKTILAP